MKPVFVVTGTDTEIGKTVASAMLVQALQADYYKPIQAGLDEQTDTQTVQRLCGISDDRIVPEAYRLNTPASPHYSAQVDGTEIEIGNLALPERNRTLIVEGAGGLLVPLHGSTCFIDVFELWQFPVILCARTVLGTINHSLLSIEALRTRNIPIQGIIFIGDPVASSESAICSIGNVKRLGRIPILSKLNSTTLHDTFKTEFNVNDFQ